MKNNSKFRSIVGVLLVSLLAVWSLSALTRAQSPATATRSISPPQLAPGEKFTVTVNIKINEQIDGLALDEDLKNFPSDWGSWTVTPVDNAGATFKASEVQWVWMSLSKGITKTVKYEVTVPKGESAGTYPIGGVVKSLSPSFESSVGGDSEVEVGNLSSKGLPSGWNLFSPPGIPQNPDPANALGDDINSLTLFYDYSPTSGYTVYPDTGTTQLAWGQGYWVHVSEDTPVDMLVDVPTQDYTLEFTEEGWKMIGAPYPVDWSQVSFSDSSDFATDGAGNVRLVSWNPNNEQYLNHYTSTSYILSPWGGYWIYVKEASSSNPASITISETDKSPTAMSTRTPLPQSVDRDQLDYPPLPQKLDDNFQALVYPNPVTNKDQVTFAVQLPNVEKIKITVTNTAGKVIYNSGYKSGERLTWGLRDSSGNKAANGIYLYKIQATSADGTSQVSEVKRLLVLR